jgi:hypothetical protein
MTVTNHHDSSSPTRRDLQVAFRPGPATSLAGGGLRVELRAGESAGPGPGRTLAGPVFHGVKFAPGSGPTPAGPGPQPEAYKYYRLWNFSTIMIRLTLDQCVFRSSGTRAQFFFNFN